MLKIGSVLDNKYEILRQIGSGGTSTVYLAMNPKLNQQWVVKEISQSIGERKMRQVLSEARMMMEFDHPAIPRIVDILQYQDATYIIMDYISGQSLAALLKENGPQPQAAVLEWAKQLCDVMEYLHTREQPIIYHDLKPGNLILKQPENNLKLIDFGEARKLVNGDAPGGGFTARYAAPEQQRATRGKTDERSDIYCVGTTLYRLLTGVFPPELPEPVGSVREQFPELNITNGMNNIILKCTEINPDKRFQSMTELKKALNEVDLWDSNYLGKLLNKIKAFATVAVLCVVMLVGGIVCNRMSSYVNNRNYDVLIETDAGVDYETKIANYLEAIEIDGSDPRAYSKLLEAYTNNETFGDEESQQFISLYNKNKPNFNMSSTEILNLNFEIGRAYFKLYTGEGDSFRARVQKAKTYFEYIHENGTEEYENYSIAESYYTLCNFFSQYVLNTGGGLEPAKEDYTAMLEVIEPCLADMNTYQSNDASAVRLSMDKSLLDMLNQNIRGFVQNEIEQSDVEQAINAISDAASMESVTQDENVNAQESVIAQAKDVMDNLNRQYISSGRLK
jgi:serine/threonine-protein kinase